MMTFFLTISIVLNLMLGFGVYMYAGTTEAFAEDLDELEDENDYLLDVIEAQRVTAATVVAELHQDLERLEIENSLLSDEFELLEDQLSDQADNNAMLRDTIAELFGSTLVDPSVASLSVN